MPKTSGYQIPAISTVIIAIISAILLLIFGSIGAKTGYDFSTYETDKFLVTSVTDGDTVVIKYNDNTESIRLIGINAPETNSDDDYTACVAQAAKNRLQDLISQQYIVLMDDTTQTNRDRYQRLLRYIVGNQAIDVGKTLLLEGLAEEYTYQTDYTKKAEYVAAVETARSTQAGMWGSELCATYK